MSEKETKKLEPVPAHGTIGIGFDHVNIKVKGKEKKPLVESTIIKDRTERRITRKLEKAMQIVYEDRKIVHIHCKSSDCGNEWKVKDTGDLSEKFDLEQNKQGISYTIKCKKCGRSYLSG